MFISRLSPVHTYTRVLRVPEGWEASSSTWLRSEVISGKLKSINHSRSGNPGIYIALARDPTLHTAKENGPRELVRVMEFSKGNRVFIAPDSDDPG